MDKMYLLGAFSPFGKLCHRSFHFSSILSKSSAVCNRENFRLKRKTIEMEKGNTFRRGNF